jgi:hypothetical protein
VSRFDSPNPIAPSTELNPAIADPEINQLVESCKDRKCLACGYDLQGLGDEPRCPECGLLNIPEG